MNRSSLSLCVVVTALAMVIPRPALAQASADIAFAYTLLNDRAAQQTFPVGWVASAARHLTDRVMIVGEAGGSYDTLSLKKTNGTAYSFMGGARARVHQGPAALPFIQFLAGGVRLSAVSGGSNTKSDFFLALQPGAGVDFPTFRRINVRAQLDYRAILAHKGASQTLRSKTMSSQLRFSIGAVLPF